MSELAKAWNSIYATFDENAFDYVGKPFYLDNEDAVMLWNGASFDTYYRSPF